MVSPVAGAPYSTLPRGCGYCGGPTPVEDSKPDSLFLTSIDVFYLTIFFLSFVRTGRTVPLHLGFLHCCFRPTFGSNPAITVDTDAVGKPAQTWNLRAKKFVRVVKNKEKRSTNTVQILQLTRKRIATCRSQIFLIKILF